MPERICPFGDGRHKKLPWQDKEKPHRSGLCCVRCGKTWEWMGPTSDPVLEETHEIIKRRAALAELTRLSEEMDQLKEIESDEDNSV